MSKIARAAEKWQAAMTGGQAAANYRAGIDATTINPMAAAADAEDRYLQGVMEASQSGRRRNRLMAVPVTVWKENSKNKGAERLATGARAAAGKMTAHFQKFGPAYEQASAAAKALPKGGIENALARVRAAITVMKQAAGKAV